MRSNFRPNIRLATNILLFIGTFAIALKIAPIAEVYEGKKSMYKIFKTSNTSWQAYQKLKKNPYSICESILKSYK